MPWGGGGNSAELPLVSSLVGKQSKLSSTHCSLAVRFVPGDSPSVVAASNQIQSLLLLLDADLCAVWTFGALGFRIIQAIRKIQIARSTLLVFTEKKKDAPHPHAKYTAAYVMFFSKGV